MPGWAIAILVIVPIVIILGCVLPIILNSGKVYEMLTEKCELTIENVISNTYKLKAKLWKCHDTRNQFTIFFQKTYKNTIEDCLFNFFNDLVLESSELTDKEGKAVLKSIYTNLSIYKDDIPFVNKVLLECDRLTSSENKYNTPTFLDMIVTFIENQIKTNKKNKQRYIKTNNGFEPLVDFINAFRNTKQTELLQPGIYIIWNKTKNLYYVGQAYNMYKRVAIGHFDTKGNCRNLLFYEDYKNGDKFFVSFIPCKREILNQKEKDTIRLYSPHIYNKTKGNI